MVWGVIRIAIFITAFLIGLLLSGSRGSSADLNSGPSQSERDTRERQCEGSTFSLAHATGKRQVNIDSRPGGM